MILIIEGPDRCGKTTLVQQLRKSYFKNPRILFQHSSSPPYVENPNAWEIRHYLSLLDASYQLNYAHDFDVVFDRFHLGAVVYGTKYRNVDPEDIFSIENLYIHKNDKNIALILLTDSAEAIWERNDDKSFEGSKEEFSETIAAFEAAFNRSIIPNKLHINVTENGGFSNTYGAVTKFLDSLQPAVEE